jgi:hypothetical protein
LKVDWHEFDYYGRHATEPPKEEMLWVVEDFYLDGEVGLGFFDGFTFRLNSGTDDCNVTHWARIEFPDKPEGET